MTFERLVVLSDLDITEAAQQELQTLSAEPIDFGVPFDVDQDAVLERANGADALLASWNAPVPREVFTNNAQLRYVGLGPVGWEVAVRANALGMRIVYPRVHRSLMLTPSASPAWNFTMR